jgi:ribonuclease HI
VDSKLIMHQMKNQWYVRERQLAEFRHEARALLDTFFKNNWELTWIPRTKNTVADAYCTQAILSNNPWIPNFLDPFRAPSQKWAPFARHRRYDDSLR